MKAQCDVDVRAAVTADATALAVFAARSFSETYGASNLPENMRAHLAASFGVSKQENEIVDPNVATLLAHQGEELVAYAQIRRKTPPSCVNRDLPIELHRFYVDRRVHGQGIAQQLMEHVRAEARARGGRHLWLSVWERNPRAIAFYKKMGFTDVGSTDFFVGADRQTDRVFTAAL